MNLVLVAEGEEEIGSPHIGQLVLRPEVQAAFAKCIGVFMPGAAQDPDGNVTVSLGAKGVVELELVASGENWGRGPSKDVHSSLKAMVDSPAWRLVKALDTLVSADGNTITIDGYPQPRPISAEERAMIAAATERRSEEKAKKLLGVQHWIDDLPWREANERLVSQPTVNIQGLVGGYTGPGGKTDPAAPRGGQDRPAPGARHDEGRRGRGAQGASREARLRRHRSERDRRLRPDEHRGRGAAHPGADRACCKRAGIDPLLWPRNAGSYPGFVFTDAPLALPSGHFGLGHGSGAHAPDEYFLIDSTNPKVQGFDGATMSYVEYLYELAK